MVENRTELQDVKTISYKNKVYLLREDVARIFLEFGETEETDIRNRCNQFAKNILKCIKVIGKANVDTIPDL